MQYYLLLCRSITHAQRMSMALERVGVRGRITRPPVGLTAKGCAYAVVVGETHYERAMRELAAAQIIPERVLFLSGDGVYREIFLR